MDDKKSSLVVWGQVPNTDSVVLEKLVNERVQMTTEGMKQLTMSDIRTTRGRRVEIVMVIGHTGKQDYIAKDVKKRGSYLLMCDERDFVLNDGDTCSNLMEGIYNHNVASLVSYIEQSWKEMLIYPSSYARLQTKPIDYKLVRVFVDRLYITFQSDAGRFCHYGLSQANYHLFMSLNPTIVRVGDDQ